MIFIVYVLYIFLGNSYLIKPIINGVFPDSIIKLKKGNSLRIYCIDITYSRYSNKNNLKWKWIKWNFNGAESSPRNLKPFEIFFNEHSILNDSNFSIVNKNTKSHITEDEFLKISYDLINSSEKDTGWYACHFENKYGFSFATTLIDIVDDNNTMKSFDHNDDKFSNIFYEFTSALKFSNIKNEKYFKIIIISVCIFVTVMLVIIVGTCYYFKISKKNYYGGKDSSIKTVITRKNKSESYINEAERTLSRLKELIIRSSMSVSSVPQSHLLNSSFNNNIKSKINLKESYELKYNKSSSNSSKGVSGVTLISSQSSNNSSLTKIKDDWEIDPNKLEFKNFLGEGAFGQVYLARINNYDNNRANNLNYKSKSIMAAAKMLKHNAGENEIYDMMAELETLKNIGHHKNIVGLIGWTKTESGRPIILVEYLLNGNLCDYLRKQRPVKIEENNILLSTKQMIDIALQISNGMGYLFSKKCIHRDLAARNVLVDEFLNIKVTDFGLARCSYDRNYYRQISDGRLPIKWMALESLFDHVFTYSSDVWSFGIVLYEIFSWGGVPYPGIPVENLFTLLKNGYRMAVPDECPMPIYQLMIDCWNEKCDKRPTFIDISKILNDILDHFDEKHNIYCKVLSKQKECDLVNMNKMELSNDNFKTFKKSRQHRSVTFSPSDIKIYPASFQEDEVFV